MKIRKKYLLGLVVFLSPLFAQHIGANLVITELMQSNVTGIMDDLNEFPDSWVELYNAGEDSENLGNYAIGLKKKIDQAYRLPKLTVDPGEYILIYCDKEATGLHTSFRLESNKSGEVYLFKNGEQLQKVSHPAFPAPDIAYGLDPETGQWGYEFVSTPGELNRGGVCEGDLVLGSPVFSESGGVKSAPVSLILSLPVKAPEDCVIKYTLDGSYPTEESPEFNGDTIVIEKSTIVKARLFAEGWLSPVATTHSYLFPDHEINLPIISLTMDDCHLYSSGLGIYVHPNCWEKKRRPVNIEYFEDSYSEAIINQLGECRIAGNGSREHPLKSMAVYANKRFGEKRLNHEFFPDMKPGMKDFKSLLLRNAGNDFYDSYMRDLVIQETVGDNMELDYQAGSTCVIFINGVYKGIVHIRERSNGDNIYSNYDGLEDIDMVENWNELKEGTIDSYNELKSFYNEEGHTAEEFNRMVDVKEYMDVQLVNLYYANCDFPGNNMVLWRPHAEGGIWRAILKDTDYGMGLTSQEIAPDFESISWLNDYDFPGGTEWGHRTERTLLFRRLQDLPDFREEFIDRAFLYMGDFLNARETLKKIEKRYSLMESEWPFHATLYDGYRNMVSVTSLYENVERMKSWIEERDEFFPHHFASYYEVGDIAFLEIDQPEKYLDVDLGVDIEVNGYRLRSGQFTGYYPVGREFTVSASPKDERVKVVGWEIKYYYDDLEDTELSEESKLSEDARMTKRKSDNHNIRLVYPEGVGRMLLRPILNSDMLKDTLTVNNIYGSAGSPDEEWYDLNGVRMEGKPSVPGVYIRKASGSVTKHLIH